MKLSEVYAVLDSVAPKSLSDEYCQKYEAYDNSVVLIDTRREVTKILLTLDVTDGAMQKAKAEEVNLIVTHHPVIYGGKKALVQDEPMDKRLMECIRLGISVVSMHLNLDVAAGGIDESLCQAVTKSSAEVGKGRAIKKAPVLMHPLTSGGYGRAYDVKECALHELSLALNKELGCQRTQVYGVKEGVKRVVSCCGAGVDEGAIAFAKAQNADVIISSDFKHHLIIAALERGISVLAPTHYATENYGYKKYFEKIVKATGLPCVYHEDKQLL